MIIGVMTAVIRMISWAGLSAIYMIKSENGEG
jgi:hypothetical protein